ncbi:MAG: AzlC family ABC transporter permease [Syntrophales bacterium]
MASGTLKTGKEWELAIRDGLSAAWPICLGYIAIGLAFGVIARETGLLPLEICLMSIVVYAGSSQFIATAMLGTGAGLIPVVLATFFINLRHLLMSSSLSPYLKDLRGGWLVLFAYGVTDESFALNMSRFREGHWEWRRALIVNHVTNLSWIISTVAGSIGGQFIPPGAFGIDYAMLAMFICLLIFQLRGPIYIFVALISGLLAVIVSLWIPGNGYILIAPVIAASSGLCLRQRKVCVTGNKESS